MSASGIRAVGFQTKAREMLTAMKLPCSVSEQNYLPGLHSHSKNKVVRTQIDQLGVLGSGCSTLYETEAVKSIGVFIVLAETLDNSTWDCNVGPLLECDTCLFVPCCQFT
jgi:hypothetical protein